MRTGRSFYSILIAIILLSVSSLAHAIPYHGEDTFTYHQPDGSTFSVKLYGSEFFAYQRTLDGREVILDPATRFWCYAQLSPDGKSFLSTGIPVVTAAKASQPIPVAAVPNQTLPDAAVLAIVQEAQVEKRVDNKGRPLAPSVTTAAALSKGLPGPPSRASLGDFVGLCILVDFPDQAGTITPAQVDNYCNQPTGYVEFGNACSVNEYFRVQSNGKFNFNNTVTAYVRMPQPKTYYDDNVDGTWGDSKAQTLVATALDILMAQGFDFTQLSRDASGYIYSINIYYAGTCSSGWSLGLWPHSWAIPTKVVNPALGIKAYRYQMSDMQTSLSIGTFCHENGHMTCLLPDLYSYLNGYSIVGYYSLMSSGSHGGGGKHPNNIDPYLKMKAGWADVVEITSASHLQATAQVDRNYFYKYTNPSDSQQYFMVENRNNTGYEGPYGGHALSVAPGLGLVVWQVFEEGSNTDSSIQEYSTYTLPYEAFIVEATPNTSYTPWYSWTQPIAGSLDTFYSGRGVNPLNDATTPELHFWDLTAFAGRTVNSGMVIHSYGAQGSSLSYTVGSGSPSATPAIGLTATALTPACDHGSNASAEIFNVFNAAGGTLNYSISDNAAWLTCSPTSGSLTTTSADITVTYDTSGLVSGTHTATITVTAAGASNSPRTIPVTLTVAPDSILAVSPATVNLTLLGGETSSTHYFTVANPGGGTMSYTISEAVSWLSSTVISGSCSNETDLIYINIDSAGLAAGAHPGSLTVTAPGASSSPQTVTVNLTVNSGLFMVSPNGGEQLLTGTTKLIQWTSNISTNIRIELLKGGVLDSVITPSTENDGAFDWAIPAGLANGLDYRIRLTTIDDAYTTQSGADFEILRPLYTADMSTNPGWTLEGAWAYGTPAGSGGDGGYPDPTSGAAGPNVIGYNLSGDYPNDMPATLYATTPSFSCAHCSGVTLSFYRWLGVEGSNYDHVNIQVSNDGVNWNTVWENPNDSVDDGSWLLYTYDISAWADDQTSVRVRWGLGSTDYSVAYCGWNLDDVLIAGLYTQPPVYAIQFQTDGTPGSSLTGSASQTIESGSNATAVTANAPAGWHFLRWTRAGAPYSTSNPLTVTNVTEAMTLVAVFEINSYTLTYTAGANGSITGTSPQTVNHGANASQVTAVPNSGYHFVQWSDGVLTAARTDSNITANLSVTASFARSRGNVQVQVTPDTASWTFTDADGGTHGGTGDSLVANIPTGSVHLTWLSLSGFAVPAAQTLQLAKDATVTFIGVYGPVVAFTTPPLSQQNYVGETVRFVLVATGGVGTLHYQWWFDDGPHAPVPVGTDAPELTINAVSLQQAGSYYCAVTDQFPSTYTCAAVALQVASHLQITQQPQGADTQATRYHDFSVQTTGGLGTLTYLWEKDGDTLGWPSASSYHLGPLALDDAGSYTVTVFDQGGDIAYSEEAVLNVDEYSVPAVGSSALLILTTLLGFAGVVVLGKRVHIVVDRYGK